MRLSRKEKELYQLKYALTVINNVLSNQGIIYFDDPNVGWNAPCYDTPEDYLLRKERDRHFKQLEGLSEEAKQIVRLIFNSPKEIFTNGEYRGWNGKITKKSIERFVYNEWKWSYRKIWKAFKEIKEWLNNL